MANHFPIKTLIGLAQDDVDAAAQRLGRAQRERNDVQSQLDSLIQYRDEYHARFTATAQTGMPAGNMRNFQAFIDTLDAAKFRALTGRGDLARVLAGLDAAVAAGMRVKTNAVALRGVNDDELVALCEHAWSRDAVPRFIEHMPMTTTGKVIRRLLRERA